MNSCVYTPLMLVGLLAILLSINIFNTTNVKNMHLQLYERSMSISQMLI